LPTLVHWTRRKPEETHGRSVVRPKPLTVSSSWPATSSSSTSSSSCTSTNHVYTDITKGRRSAAHHAGGANNNSAAIQSRAGKPRGEGEGRGSKQSVSSHHKKYIYWKSVVNGECGRLMCVFLLRIQSLFSQHL